jgi:hypothetical protein
MAAMRTRMAVGPLAWLAMLAIFVSGTTKLLDLSAFAEALQGWDLVPATVRVVAVVTVPLVEMALGLAWVIGLRNRSLLLSAGGLLLAFTLVYGLHVVFSTPPACGCFGKLIAHKTMLDHGPIVLARNGIMIAVIAAAVVQRQATTDMRAQ